MRKKRNAFTLIELLAVIVILAVILVIAIPRILDVIDVSKKDSFKTSAQLIADSAEKKYVENKLNNIDEEITCDKVAKISSKDYEYCFVKINEEGKATVTIEGKGKFKGMGICNASKETSEISDTCSTKQECFGFKDGAITGYDMGTPKVTVKDEGKCKKYMMSVDEEIATTLCSGNSLDGTTLQQAVSDGEIPSTDYEEAGLIVETGKTVVITGYSRKGGVYVIIPEKIDGKTVVGISEYAFTTRGVTPTGISTNKIEYNIQPLYNYENKYDVVKITTENYGLGITSVEIPDTVTSIGYRAFAENQLTSITIPTSVTSIGDYAFANNQLTSVTIPSSVTDIGAGAFNSNQLSDKDAFIYKRNSDGGIDNTTIVSYGGKNIHPIIPNTVKNIGDYAFNDNQLQTVTIPTSVTSIGSRAFAYNKLTSVTIPSSVTSIGSGAFRKVDSSNPNLTKIINKTGKSFDWGSIVNDSYGYNFVTGTVVNSYGNVEVVSE